MAAFRTAAAVAASAGLLAWFASTEPTGTAGLDPLYRTVAAVVITLLAARATTKALAIGAVIVALGATGGPVLVTWPAAVAAGLAVGMAATDRGAAGLRAAIGGVVTVCAFHLTWPDTTTATTGMALAAVFVPAVSGLVRLDPGMRRAALVAGAAVLALGGMASMLGLLAAMRARPDVDAGADRAQAGLEAVRRGDVASGARSLEAAGRSFTAARHKARAWSARPALAVPVVAQHSRAVSTLASTGAEIADVGARLAEVFDPATFKVVGGTVPIERVDALVGPAEEAAAVLVRRAAELEQVGGPWLVAPVRREVDRLTPRVRRAGRDAEVAARTARLAPALLGADGPRRWFLAVQSPAELRGTGGFIGSFAELYADKGRLQLTRVGRTADLNIRTPRKLDAPVEYLARYGRFDPHLLWQNVNMSPDFPTVADVIARLYPQSGGAPLDGVIAVDPYGLAAILGATGPVRVADWPEPITTESAARVLLYEQYVRFPQSGERVDFLAHVTQAVWQRLLDGSVGIVELGRALVGALDEKHLVFTSTQADEQSVLVGLGVTGTMAPVDDDFLAVVTQNAGGNKIDWFLRRAVDYRVDVDRRTGRVQATLQVTLRNEAPASGLPVYVIGSARKPPPPPGTNSVYLSVYTPWALLSASLDGQTIGLESQQELGRRVYSAFVDVPPGASVVMELTLSGTRTGLDDRYDVAVHRQPAVTADNLVVSVNGREERAELRTDRTFSLPIRG